MFHFSSSHKRRPGIPKPNPRSVRRRVSTVCSRSHYGHKTPSSGKIRVQCNHTPPRGVINPKWTRRFPSSRRRRSVFRFLHLRRPFPNAWADGDAVSPNVTPHATSTRPCGGKSRPARRRCRKPRPSLKTVILLLQPRSFNRQHPLRISSGLQRHRHRLRHPCKPPDEKISTEIHRQEAGSSGPSTSPGGTKGSASSRRPAAAASPRTPRGLQTAPREPSAVSQG